MDYRGNVGAELWHALSVSMEAASLALNRALKDGHWRGAPREWIAVAQRLAHLDDAPDSFATLIDRLARTLRAGKLEDPERIAVVELAAALRATDHATELGATLRWLASNATPGDAATVVAVLGHVWFYERDAPESGSRLPDAAFALVEWLLHSGAAELRMHGRSDAGRQGQSGQPHRDAQRLRGADLLFHVALITDADGRRHHLPIALRYLFSAEHAEGSWQQGTAREIWQLTESGLANGMSSRTCSTVERKVKARRVPTLTRIQSHACSAGSRPSTAAMPTGAYARGSVSCSRGPASGRPGERCKPRSTRRMRRRGCCSRRAKLAARV